MQLRPFSEALQSELEEIALVGDDAGVDGAAVAGGVQAIDSPASAGVRREMFFHLPFGHAEVRVDTRDPHKLCPSAALEVIRRVRARRP
jgi:hypothetical protein